MAGRLSFSIAINLLTENFKKGTNTVKNGFRSMQARVLAFAAALGFAGVSLSNLVSEIIRVARETSKAVTALKNVSGSTAQFADNLRFTTALAKKYGAYVNDITGNFAKFTAAASIAGMSMDDQRKIFESLSRAAAGFGLSADETNGMFLAVTQMMGKGKIQAEELRGQLGERLPIAMQAMAKAAGTTVAGLDELMKEGKLLSANVLPKFADALNKMIPNVDTDNIETSLNRLKNAFQEIVNYSGVQSSYKSLIDWLTNLLQSFKDQVSNIFIGLAAVILSGLTKSATKLVSSLGAAQNSILKNQEKTQAQAILATERRHLAELNLERAKANYIKATDAEILAAKTEVKKAEIALKAATTREVKALAAQEAAASKAAILQSTGVFASFKSFVKTAAGKIAASLKMMWASFGPALIVAGLTAVIGKFIEMRNEAKRIRNLYSDYKKESFSIGRPEDADKLQRLYRIASNIKETEKVRKNALSEINNLLGTSYNINKNSLKINGDINTKVAERIRLLKDAAAIEFYQRRKLDAESEANAIIGKYGSVENLNSAATVSAKAGNSLAGWIGKLFNIGGAKDAYEDAVKVDQLKRIYQDSDKQINLFEKNILSKTPVDTWKSKKKTDLQKAEEAYSKATTVLTNKLKNRTITERTYERELAKLNKATYETLSGLLTPEQASKNKSFQAAQAGAPISKTFELENDYWDEMNKYSRQFAANLLTEKEYAKAKFELTEKTLKEVTSLEDIGEAGEAFVLTLTESAASLRKEVLKIPSYKDRDKTFDYKKTNLERLRADKDNQQGHVDKLKSEIGGDADEIEEKLKVAKGNLEAIKKEYGNVAAELIEELNKALGNATTLEDALKIAEVKQDIKDLTKELNQGMYSGMKDIASNADRLVSAFSNLSDVMSDEDATAWERILAVWNAMTNTVDAFLSVISMIESLTEITKKLGEAKQKEAELDSEKAAVSMTNAAATSAEASANVALASSIELLKKVKDEQTTADEVNAQKEVTNNAIRIASDKMAAVTGMGLDEMAADKKVETATKEVAANTAAGASEAGKGAAKLPFPYNIIAIGGAIAAAIAAFAMIPKFASGGIIQGSTSGDRNLARVNGGEMILNGRQQATLFQLANGRGIRTNSEGGKVEFEIRYDRLVGVLDNGNKKQGRGR